MQASGNHQSQAGSQGQMMIVEMPKQKKNSRLSIR